MEQEPPLKKPRLLPEEEPKDANREEEAPKSGNQDKPDTEQVTEEAVKIEATAAITEPTASSEKDVNEESNTTESEQAEQKQDEAQEQAHETEVKPEQQEEQPTQEQQQQTQQQEQQQQQTQQEQQQQQQQQQQQLLLQPQEQQQQQQQQEIDALAAAHLQQMNVAQAQALAQAAAAAVSANGEANYHQLFANLDASTAFAAAMAAVNSNNAESASQASSHTQIKPENASANSSQVDMGQSAAEILKRELMNQKVRADNRERKKRWRLQNEERNKDNDLRCRVNKRAHKLFGKEDSEHKQRWIDDEFLKRQQKRKEKERRKGLVDNSLGAHGTNLQPSPAIDLAALAQQLVPHQQPLQMTETNYLTLLCNNLGIPAVARSLITGSIPTTATSNPEISAPVDPSTSAAAAAAAVAAVASTTQEGENGDHDSKDKVQQFPFQLLELLQQLQQYQPQNQGTSENAGTSDSAEFQLPNNSSNSNSNTAFNAATSSALSDGDDARPEEKLAALLTSTLQAASAAAATSLTETKEGENKEESTQEGEGSGNQQQQQQQQQNAEFPMDAVLTLMQLNAGWRQ